MSQALRALVFGISMLLPSISHAQPPDLWFEPADNVTQGRQEFSSLFTQPQQWSQTASQTKVFFVSGNSLLQASDQIAKQQLQFLAAHNIQLAVGVLALPVDKHVCGDAVEGMVWPGEVANLMKRLKTLNADVAYFSLDEPLSYGHFYTGKNACRLSITDTAHLLANSIRVMRAAYPNVRIVEAEVPTGKPPGVWEQALPAWLDAYRAQTGENLYGFSMDAYWEHPWPSVVQHGVQILRQHNVHAGLYLHADAQPGMTAAQWTARVQKNACAVRSLQVVPDYVIVANWMIKAVKDAPETDPNSLAALTRWVGGLNWTSGNTCDSIPP